jgi:NAD(P)-dependent dehydrogenase (short-subunit alcohol dehydrogenase family)
LKVVLITGSTRGIGFGLARSLIERNCRVVVSGRKGDSVQAAVEKLTADSRNAHVSGHVCDVRSEESLQGLWNHAVTQFGRIDIWVNNAGISNQPAKVWMIDSSEIAAVVDTNILGSILGTKVAIRRMLEQGHGAVYLMEGMGSDGRSHSGLTIYGMTKYALDYFFRSLSKELEDTALIAGAIRPGMVVTDLIIEPYRGKPDEWARVKPIFNIIADPLDTVSEWMAEAVLANDQNGQILSRLSSFNIALRFLKAPFTRRDLFSDIEID